MKIIRKQYIETNAFQVGDQIAVGKYTATCQKISDQGAIFMLDQYLDEPYRMNVEGTNEGGYEASDLQRNLSNRIAQRKGEEYEWGWLQNKVKKSAPCFTLVTPYGGYATYNNASNSAGVRSVFMIKKAVN